MELSHLRALIGIGELANFRKAGERLHLSPPAVFDQTTIAQRFRALLERRSRGGRRRNRGRSSRDRKCSRLPRERVRRPLRNCAEPLEDPRWSALKDIREKLKTSN